MLNLTNSCPAKEQVCVPPQVQRGFTLIELLITISLMLLFVGGGMAAMIRFNARQEVAAASHELAGYIKSAQKRAISRQQVDGCVLLHGYRISIDTNFNSVEITPLCGETRDGATPFDNPVKTTSVSSGVNIEDTDSLDTIIIDFHTLHGGATPASFTVTSNSNPSYYYQIDVNSGGDIEISRQG